jgi:hypothetical protein
MTTTTTTSTTTATISFTWKQLETLLRELAESREQASMVPHLVSGLAKQYLFLEESLLLSEIMKMAVCVADPNFRPAELLRSPGSASSEGSCSLP